MGHAIRRGVFVVGGFGVIFGLGLATALAARIECTGGACQGSSRADKIIGSELEDAIFANGGADRVQGRGTGDQLYGDQGADTVSGGGGPDKIEGGFGSDTLRGGAAHDIYEFRPAFGRDVIKDDPIAPNGSLFQATRFDFVDEDLVIRMTSAPGAEAKTANGEDRVNWGQDTIDLVIDGHGDDQITGRAVADNIQMFNGGADTVDAGDGDDNVYTQDGAGDDTIHCGAGAADAATIDSGDTTDGCETVTR